MSFQTKKCKQMKQIKNILLLLIIIAPFIAFSQKAFNESMDATAAGSVFLDFEFGDIIRVKTWNKAEVKVEGSAAINNGKDDDKFVISSHKKGDRIVFESEVKDMNEISNITKLKTGNTITESHTVDIDITYDVCLPAGMELIIETVSANVELTGLEGPVSVETISGFIDVGISSEASASLKLETLTGDLYSDLEISVKEEKSSSFIGQKIYASLNEGSNKVELKSISGDIFLRNTKK
jgi:hypothetical protein